MEEWRDIAGYEGQYQVSNLGNVRTLSDRHGKTRLMKLGQQVNGYLAVRLTKFSKSKLCYVHRLVADAFIPNPEGKPEVNHIHGIKTDNRASELEWSTPKENTQHSYNIGLKPLKSYRFNHPVHGSILCTQPELCRLFNLQQSCVSRLALGKRNKYQEWTIEKLF